VSHCRGQPANARQPHDERGRHERRAHVTQGLSAGRSADTDSTKTVATASDVCMQARQLLSQLGLHAVADGTDVVAATDTLPATDWCWLRTGVQCSSSSSDGTSRPGAFPGRLHTGRELLLGSAARC
jgi:hypothetical protein